eukprot:TRINITY_DN31671_c0_g1_i1.p1 TRINITY_DN31671_c0_g1~~TRINITY_DN31671_c0_g1_i1.p1  ORF type:complete len:136 (-),score=16.93 TRINITY_DN31671_c0_g1_i1:117-524(-)
MLPSNRLRLSILHFSAGWTKSHRGFGAVAQGGAAACRSYSSGAPDEEHTWPDSGSSVMGRGRLRAKKTRFLRLPSLKKPHSIPPLPQPVWEEAVRAGKQPQILELPPAPGLKGGPRQEYSTGWRQPHPDSLTRKK